MRFNPSVASMVEQRGRAFGGGAAGLGPEPHDKLGANRYVPIEVELPGGQAPPAERFQQLLDGLAYILDIDQRTNPADRQPTVVRAPPATVRDSGRLSEALVWLRGATT